MFEQGGTEKCGDEDNDMFLSYKKYKREFGEMRNQLQCWMMMNQIYSLYNCEGYTLKQIF